MIKLPRNNIAVVPIYDPDYSPSGRIIIPEQAKERCDQGIVKYLGPEVKDLKIGDYVLFSGYTGTLIRMEGEGSLIIMSEDFVTCVVADVPDVDVPGLYFRGPDGYFMASYEMALEIIGEAFKESQFHRNIRTRNKLDSRPKPEELIRK